MNSAEYDYAGKELIKFIEIIVDAILKRHRLIGRQWHNGKIKTVISSTLLEVYIDGDTTAIKVPCNPSVTFNINDEVLVLFVNGDSNNKFVISKRGL